VKPSILTRKVLLIVLYMFGFVLKIPNLFTFRPVLDKTSNDSIWVLHETEFSKSQANYKYRFWIHCFLLCILPLVIMIVLNVSIAKSIRESFSKIENHVSAILTKTKQVGIESNTSMFIRIYFLNSGSQHQPHTVFVTAFFLVLLLWECIATCF
jgi:hypothetical protein